MCMCILGMHCGVLVLRRQGRAMNERLFVWRHMQLTYAPHHRCDESFTGGHAQNAGSVRSGGIFPDRHFEFCVGLALY